MNSEIKLLEIEINDSSLTEITSDTLRLQLNEVQTQTTSIRLDAINSTKNIHSHLKSIKMLVC